MASAGDGPWVEWWTVRWSTQRVRDVLAGDTAWDGRVLQDADGWLYLVNPDGYLEFRPSAAPAPGADAVLAAALEVYGHRSELTSEGGITWLMVSGQRSPAAGAIHESDHAQVYDDEEADDCPPARHRRWVANGADADGKFVDVIYDSSLEGLGCAVDSARCAKAIAAYGREKYGA